MSCDQKLKDGGTCPAPAVCRYEWPGRGERCACEEHAVDLKTLAAVLGFSLQFTPIGEVNGKSR